MLPKVHTFTHHPALVRDIGCYCWGAMQLKLGGIRSLLSAVGDRLSLCRVRGTLPKKPSLDLSPRSRFARALRRHDAYTDRLGPAPCAQGQGSGALAATLYCQPCQAISGEGGDAARPQWQPDEGPQEFPGQAPASPR